MGSLFKLIAGVVIGAGIGVAAAKIAERRQDQADEFGFTDDTEPSGFKTRLRQAGEVARSARAEREAELQKYFRRRVNDPSAFTPPVGDTIH